MYWIFITALLMLIICLKHLEGVTEVTIRCLAGGFTGEKSKVECTLKGKSNKGITMYHPNNGNPRWVMRCPSPSSCNCAKGYMYDVLESTDTVVLVILAFNPDTDAGQWSCRIGEAADRQAVCNKTISYKLTTVEMKTKEGPFPSGVATDFRCETNPTYPPATITWIEGEKKLTKGINSRSYNRRHYGVVTVSLLTKVFTIFEHSQRLYCSARNGDATVKSEIATLEITGDYTGGGCVCTTTVTVAFFTMLLHTV